VDSFACPSISPQFLRSGACKHKYDPRADYIAETQELSTFTWCGVSRLPLFFFSLYSKREKEAKREKAIDWRFAMQIANLFSEFSLNRFLNLCESSKSVDSYFFPFFISWLFSYSFSLTLSLWLSRAFWLSAL
jgi:hypothetical protein